MLKKTAETLHGHEITENCFQQEDDDNSKSDITPTGIDAFANRTESRDDQENFESRSKITSSENKVATATKNPFKMVLEKLTDTSRDSEILCSHYSSAL